MGIEYTYRRLPQQELERLENDPEAGMQFMMGGLPGFDLQSMTALLQDPAAMKAKGADLMAAFAEQADDPTRADLYKEWHVIHFLLTGDQSLDPNHKSDNLLHNVVMGGHDTSLERGYGPPRMFSVDEVRATAQELVGISVDELRARFSAEKFNAARIYPSRKPSNWDEEQIEPALELYSNLVRLFQEAANAGEIVIVYAS